MLSTTRPRSPRDVWGFAARIFLCSLLLNALTRGAFADGPSTRHLAINGRVEDSLGRRLSGVSITIQTVSGKVVGGYTTGQDGVYGFPGVAAGAYNLSVELQGFKKFQQTRMTLQVDQNAEINAVLEVGQLTEIVEIQGQAPLVENTSASMGAVIDTQKITQLPLNGRNFVQLALLVPGANTGAPGATNGGGFSVGGARSEQNAFQIERTVPNGSNTAWRKCSRVEPGHESHFCATGIPFVKEITVER